jgi:hypothetical protein
MELTIQRNGFPDLQVSSQGHYSGSYTRLHQPAHFHVILPIAKQILIISINQFLVHQKCMSRSPGLNCTNYFRESLIQVAQIGLRLVDFILYLVHDILHRVPVQGNVAL